MKHRMSRRSFVFGIGAATFGAARLQHARAASVKSTMSADSALAELMAGNARFVAGQHQHPGIDVLRRRELAAGQSPFAVILGCSDSRVPPSLVFDRGLGDLFVVRVAGNIADPAGIASIEYAVDHLGSPLIFVLGHEKCGAVDAVLGALGSGHTLPGHLNLLVDAIAPAIKQARAEGGDVLQHAIDDNVKHVVGQLKNSQPLLAPAINDGKAKVVGGIYRLATGKIDLIELS